MEKKVRTTRKRDYKVYVFTSKYFIAVLYYLILVKGKTFEKIQSTYNSTIFSGCKLAIRD